MLATKLYKDSWEVDARLTNFGVTKSELEQVAFLTLAARLESVDADPKSAPGLLSYIYGTRYLRHLFGPKGWISDRHENIESILNVSTGDRIVYQNVDSACLSFTSPRAISGKGAAASRMVDVAQGHLFEDLASPEVVPLTRVHSINSRVWYFCVSFDRDEVRAELSLPATINSNNFMGFIERIFVAQSGSEGPIKIGSGGEPPLEFEPTILRK